MAKVAAMQRRQTVCGHCGYDLASLSRVDVCPECGTQVATAVAGGPLGEASAAYLRTLLSGSRWIFWSLVASIILGVAWLVGAVMFAIQSQAGAATGTGTQLASMALFEWTGQLVRIAPELALAWGVWLLTRRDVGVDAKSDPARTRWIARIALLTSPLCSCVAGLMGALGFPLDPFVEGLTAQQLSQAIAYTVADLSSGLTDAVGVVATMFYVARLADRIPDEGFEKRCRSFAVAFGVLTVVGGCIAIAGLVAFCLFVSTMYTMLRYAKYLVACKPGPAEEEFYHSRPLA
jgi:hypothetical protein